MRIRMFVWVAALLAVGAAGLLSAPLPATAENLKIEAFYGRFQGSGVAENQDSLYFGVTVRDLDVAIGPADGGFFVEWTSVIRGGGDPEKPDVRRRTSRAVFQPAARAGVYNVIPPGDPAAGGLMWARLKERTLTVHVMHVRPDGGYVVQSYDRTLAGTGMELKFVSVRDGEPVRQVNARLVKVAN